MSEQKQQIFEFDNFRLDPMNRTLLRDGSPVALPAKAFDILAALVESGGRLVGKDELFSRVWPDQIVEESNLTVHISAIRKALGDRKDNPHYLVTVSGHGYRFTGSLVSSTESAGENAVVIQPTDRTIDTPRITGENAVSLRRKSVVARPLLFGSLAVIGISLVIFLGFKRNDAPDRSTPTAQIKSIAVLPFKPLVSGEREESLEIGMADTLITRLSRISQLTVRPTSAVRQYTKLEDEATKAGQELMVDAVLDGTIQRSGDRVRVGVRLVRVDKGQTLWTEQFDEASSNIFAIQDAISAKLPERWRCSWV